MDEKNLSKEGSYGGKTAGSIGGGLYLYLCSLIPENNPLHSVAMYAAPFIAVWVNDIGGVIIYEVKSAALSKMQHIKLERLKKRIDDLPNSPEAEGLKKEVTERYFKVHSEILFLQLEGIQKMSRSADAEIKGAAKEKGLKGG